jgi:hypothetical protein
MKGTFNFCELYSGEDDNMTDLKLIEVPIPETILSRDYNPFQISLHINK